MKPLGAVGVIVNGWKFQFKRYDKPSSIFSKYHLYYTFNIKYEKSGLFISASSDDNPVRVFHVDFDSDN